MKTTTLNTICSISIFRTLFFSLFIGNFIFPGISSAQNIMSLNNAGLNDGLSSNSTRDDQGNIYYCTLADKNNEFSLNVSCFSKELILLWSYNYNVNGIIQISGIHYTDGKIIISFQGGIATPLILVLDTSGNILTSKMFSTFGDTKASCLLHNKDYIIASRIPTDQGIVEISRLTSNFSVVFNKQIQFLQRGLVEINDIKQIGSRIYFCGSAEDTSRKHSYWFFGSLELNGTLVYLNEYELENTDPYSENKLMSFDSLSTDVVIASGYSGNTYADANTKRYYDGLILKINTQDGSISDHLVLSPNSEMEWIKFFGLKTQGNNLIRICGTQGTETSFNLDGLLFSELSADFRNYNFIHTKQSNAWLNKFSDFNFISGSINNQAILLSAVGEGICNTNIPCFETPHIISLNKDIHPVSNRYSLSDVQIMLEDFQIQKKPIQVTLSANCGLNTCENTHTIEICKQQYIYDYSYLKENPKSVINLTSGITDMLHDRINKKIIIDPLQSGTAMILMERTINIYLKQLDTFKFVILNDSLPILDLGPDQVLCNGDSAILSFGFDSTRWFDGSIRKSITVKNAGTYWGTYFNSCGSMSDTIIISTQQAPKLNIGDDILLCGSQSGSLSSNYDNTIWSNGASGRSITVNTAGTIIGFVSTVCGVSYDTVEVFKFDKSMFSAGSDLLICDPLITLTANFRNPNVLKYTASFEWKQIDALASVNFDDRQKLNPLITNLTKDESHFFELNIQLGNSCVLKDTIRVFSKTCFIDTCAFIIERNCLANGMVELRAMSANGKTIIPKARQQEFFWDIKDGPTGRGYSVTNKNPITVSNHTRYCLTSKLYSWPKGRPHTVEFAEICEIKSCDSLKLNCTGPCEDFSFILSSCLDDYAVDYNLFYPSGLCKSVCINSCDYIVAVFGLDGFMLDSRFYNIKWSTDESGAITRQMGCINYNLTVEVRSGDCVWYGRYRPSCSHQGGFSGNQIGMRQTGPGNIDMLSLRQMQENSQEFKMYNNTGQYLGQNTIDLEALHPGIFFIETKENNQRIVRKVFIGGR